MKIAHGGLKAAKDRYLPRRPIESGWSRGHGHDVPPQWL